MIHARHQSVGGFVYQSSRNFIHPHCKGGPSTAGKSSGLSGTPGPESYGVPLGSGLSRNQRACPQVGVYPNDFLLATLRSGDLSSMATAQLTPWHVTLMYARAWQRQRPQFSQESKSINRSKAECMDMFASGMDPCTCQNMGTPNIAGFLPVAA